MPAPTPVTVQATKIDTFFLPDNFSTPYRLYVLQQSSDLSAVANQANNAAGTSYDNTLAIAALQTAVDENTSDIANIEVRLDADEAELADHETRITTNANDIAAIETRLDADELDIADLQTHAIRDDTTGTQSVVSAFNTTQYYSVNNIQVIASRETGWTADTGTAILGGMNADLAFTVSAAYTQSEMQAIATALVEARKQIKALTDLVIYHGLAGI